MVLTALAQATQVVVVDSVVVVVVVTPQAALEFFIFIIRMEL
jgi:hypothetical protein